MYRLPGYCGKGIPVPRVLCHSLTEVTEVPDKGTCTGIQHKFQKFRVRVTELTDVPGIVARASITHICNKNDVPVPQEFVAMGC